MAMGLSPGCRERLDSREAEYSLSRLVRGHVRGVRGQTPPPTLPLSRLFSKSQAGDGLEGPKHLWSQSSIVGVQKCDELVRAQQETGPSHLADRTHASFDWQLPVADDREHAFLKHVASPPGWWAVAADSSREYPGLPVRQESFVPEPEMTLECGVHRLPASDFPKECAESILVTGG